jgi:hypothetical protein
VSDSGVRYRSVFVVACVLLVAGCRGGRTSASVSSDVGATATTTTRSPSSPVVSEPSTEAESTTSTSGSPTAPRLLPVSATFVSPQRAWVLEANQSQCPPQSDEAPCVYRVFGTADGGTTWQPLGFVHDSASDLRIRFADEKHGFAFDRTQIFATDDGGEHWRLLATSFRGVQTLEIAHGVVCIVALAAHPGVQDDFHVWSTRADQLHWTMDPLAIPIGAGPVPMQQLVFVGNDGYLMNLDRTVLGGARLLPTRRWKVWTPPCLDVAGPASLAASSGVDLVALCDEGTWGGPTVTPAVYFSHDGGLTFHRRIAPTYGLLSSPDLGTAVIAIGQTLWRTTNEGATWQAVYGPHETAGEGAIELGFTTTSQAYAILAANQMLITRDHGATWTPFGP